MKQFTFLTKAAVTVLVAFPLGLAANPYAVHHISSSLEELEYVEPLPEMNDEKAEFARLEFSDEKVEDESLWNGVFEDVGTFPHQPASVTGGLN